MDRLTVRRANGRWAVAYRRGERPMNNVLRAIDRLAAYEDAEEQGLLVRLPCKVGDSVYNLWYEPCHFGNTYPDSVDCDGCEDACDLMRAVVECKAPSVEWIIRNMTSKRPFAYATREEAEAALAKEKPYEES